MRGHRFHEVPPRVTDLLSFNKKSLTCSYKGVAHGTPALLIWNYPLHRGWNFFEVEILDKGLCCEISIGLAHSTYSSTRHVGWDCNSIGYHSDNGRLYHASGLGKEFGYPCTTGDIMGCGIDFDALNNEGMAQVYFTKNGERIKDCVEVKIPKGGLFPSFTMNSEGEQVRLLLSPSSQYDNDEENVVMSEPNQLLPKLTKGWARVSTGLYLDCTGSFIEHQGGSNGHNGISLIQWSQPISRSFNSFKLEILDVVGAIAISLASPIYQFEQFPGWRENSIAYHSDDGRCYHGSGIGIAYGPACKSGDTMALWVTFDFAEDDVDGLTKRVKPNPGILKEFSLLDDESESSDKSGNDESYEKQEISVIFMRNGKKLGSIKTSIPEDGFFPTIGLLKNGEKIKVNMQPYSG